MYGMRWNPLKLHVPCNLDFHKQKSGYTSGLVHIIIQGWAQIMDDLYISASKHKMNGLYYMEIDMYVLVIEYTKTR